METSESTVPVPPPGQLELLTPHNLGEYDPEGRLVAWSVDNGCCGDPGDCDQCGGL